MYLLEINGEKGIYIYILVNSKGIPLGKGLNMTGNEKQGYPKRMGLLQLG